MRRESGYGTVRNGLRNYSCLRRERSEEVGKGEEHIERAGMSEIGRDEAGTEWKPCLRSKRHVTATFVCSLCLYQQHSINNHKTDCDEKDTRMRHKNYISFNMTSEIFIYSYTIAAKVTYHIISCLSWSVGQRTLDVIACYQSFRVP